MKVMCCFCHEFIKEVEPIEDDSVSHGICPPCLVSERAKLKKRRNKNKIIKQQIIKTLLLFLLSFSSVAITQADYDKIIIGKTTEAELIKFMPTIVMSRQVLVESYRLCKPFGEAKKLVIYGEGTMSFYINDKTGIVCNKRK